ncbi:hypothetical protein J2J97_32225 (plasmid) [Rhizobium bangladeshense]|uniref:hypothetical protein n=1 Tax=Rhizobium bangladeshense TaxID=1138189 RepID=UPI001A986646|nr:hypothetical protein [Rhizobium bangladeshense]QSY98573.1 hypothetical protein J2J97_32225 [Rhizobium bangladeshense]
MRELSDYQKQTLRDAAREMRASYEARGFPINDNSIFVEAEKLLRGDRSFPVYHAIGNDQEVYGFLMMSMHAQKVGPDDVPPEPREAPTGRALDI